MKKNKFYIIMFGVLQTISIYSQKKEILIIDKTTNLPVEGVNIYYPSIEEGTFTNSDGKALVNTKKLDLKISHINFNEVIIKPDEFLKSNDFYLTPKSIVLDEVIVSNFNLEKSINYVLDNYENLYINKPFEKECAFKETLSVNKKLKRVIVTKVNWWGKSYMVKYLDDLKLRLGSIEFNKNEPMNIFTDSPDENKPSKSGFVETKNLISNIYLNTFLKNFLTNTANLVTTIEKSAEGEIAVSYESDWKTIKDYSIKSKGIIVFDKTSKAIISFTNEIENKNKIVNASTSISKKDYSYENKSSISKLNFKKDLNNKWTLNSYEANADFNITYNKVTHECNFTNNIFVLKEAPIKKVNNDGLIDFNIPLYQNLPANIISGNNSILLTEEEKNFIFSTK